ncbi:hypothetical protein JOF53_005438 [Crossiella equi]|uniref:GNAT family N-acetyltransferase n=1 Tax=Crossiella equi TaxID=130796 RepID=A0ABS5AJ40_9PSEU|nr:hypothetical protein [Crossiella equi]
MRQLPRADAEVLLPCTWVDLWAVLAGATDVTHRYLP